MTSEIQEDGVPPNTLDLVGTQSYEYGGSCEAGCEESERPCLIEIIKQFWNEAREGPEPSTKLLYGLILFKHKILQGTRVGAMELGTASFHTEGSNFEQFSLENISPEELETRRAELAAHNAAAEERERRGLTSGTVTGAQALAILCSSGAAPTTGEAKLILSKENWTDEELKAKLLETCHPEDTPRYLLQGLRGLSNKGSVEVTKSRLMAYLMTGAEGLTQEEAQKFIQTIGDADKYNLEQIMNKITSQ